jgi:hypothetical protein
MMEPFHWDATMWSDRILSAVELVKWLALAVTSTGIWQGGVLLIRGGTGADLTTFMLLAMIGFVVLELLRAFTPVPTRLPDEKMSAPELLSLGTPILFVGIFVFAIVFELSLGTASKHGIGTLFLAAFWHAIVFTAFGAAAYAMSQMAKRVRAARASQPTTDN